MHVDLLVLLFVFFRKLKTVCSQFLNDSELLQMGRK